MNERIKELYQQAHSIRYHDSDPSREGNPPTVYWQGEVSAQRFAELLIRECIGILSRNNPCPPGSTIMYSLIQDEYFDKGWQVAVETKSNQIKKHFGVEE